MINVLRRTMVVAALVALVAGGLGMPRPAYAFTADEVMLVPREGGTFTIGTRSYAGDLEIKAAPNGLVVVEHVTLDEYLAGIREVPFSWPSAALEAQAVAARSYLASTLSGGRRGDAARYGFDICATTACQVYAGTGLIEGPDGERWAAAIDATTNEILVYDGAPATTFYSSSAGPRTRAVEDVFGGSPRPYLVAVASPEQDATPYLSWSVELEAEVYIRILRAAGYSVPGDLVGVEVGQTQDGGGPWKTQTITTTGVTSIPNTAMRNLFNRYGTRLYPGLLPAQRPDGRPWPQAVLSYTYTADFAPGTGPTPPAGLAGRLPDDDSPDSGTVILTGTGWGHGVGMSQWGAFAMAEAGASYDEILGHYYGNLAPVDAGDLLSDNVAVGLRWGTSEVVFDASDSFSLVVDGSALATLPAGTWTLRLNAGAISLVPPDRTAPGLPDIVFSQRWPK